MKLSTSDFILLFFVAIAAMGHVLPGKPKHFRHGVAWDYRRDQTHRNRTAYYDSREMAKRGSNPATR